MDKEKKKVLFLCTHNSARSQMAEGLLNHLYGDSYEAFSAGTEPSSVYHYAVQVMNEIGIDISRQRSKSVDELLDMPFDYIVTVCDSAKEACPYFPHGKNTVHKGFSDPSALSGAEDKKLKAFRDTRDEIKSWISEYFRHQ